MKKQQIIIFKSLDKLQRFCAQQFIDVVKANPKAKIGFATGSSPVQAYAWIIKDHLQKQTSWKNVWGFNLDEFVGIKPSHPQAFVNQMNTNLYNHIDIQKKNVFIPNCAAKKPEEEAKNYEALIRKKGPIDFQYVSLGANGHMAYNEPGTPLESLTHVVKLNATTISAMIKAGKFQSPAEAPKEAITMGVKTILETTNKVMMVAYGQHKAKATKIMLEATPNSKVTASALQNHRNCFYVLDQDAAAQLSKQTLKRAQYL